MECNGVLWSTASPHSVHWVPRRRRTTASFRSGPLHRLHAVCAPPSPRSTSVDGRRPIMTFGRIDDRKWKAPMAEMAGARPMGHSDGFIGPDDDHDGVVLPLAWRHKEHVTVSVERAVILCPLYDSCRCLNKFKKLLFQGYKNIWRNPFHERTTAGKSWAWFQQVSRHFFEFGKN